MNTSSFRRSIAALLIGILSLTFAACGGSGGAKLDGVYHAASGGPITITIKGSKATVQIAGEAKTLDCKVDGNQLKILDPSQGEIAFTINADGTLTGQLGLMTKKTP